MHVHTKGDVAHGPHVHLHSQSHLPFIKYKHLDEHHTAYVKRGKEFEFGGLSLPII